MATYDTALYSIGASGHPGTSTGHFYLDTLHDSASIRLNARNYTDTTGDKNAVQIKPYQTVSKTSGGIKALELNPKVDDACTIATIQGLDSCVEIKGTTGNISGKVWCLRAKMESGSGTTRTMTGPFAMISCKNSMHGTVTNGIYVMDIETIGGGTAWTAFAKFPDDGAIASDSGTATPGAHGWIKVVIGSATRYIGVVNTPS